VFDLNHPFFIPLWRRVAVVAFAVGWGLFEFASGSPFWGTLFLGIGGYAFWGLFLAFDASAAAQQRERSDEEGRSDK
jgi:hypothetical protein